MQKQRVLFIDRDGTLIKEPPVDFQVDSLEKLEFMPGVFRNLFRLRTFTSYKLVIVSNQDGRGTASFPEEDFIKPHEKFLQAFLNEGIRFDEILIDPSMPSDNSPNRKPGTGMLKHYLNDTYDLENSFVIGDRYTDVQLAQNMGTKAILLETGSNSDAVNQAAEDIHCALVSDSWDAIASYLISAMRRVTVARKTGETDIHITLGLDGTGKSGIRTGLGFFDHMLDQVSRHGGVDLYVEVKGDLNVDEHHTIEDTGIALGEAFFEALGNKKGVQRYGFILPMDDCLAQVAIDFGGRPWLVWEAEFKREKIGDMPTEMFYHFFKSFCDAAKCNLNIKVEGTNEHHKIEAIFKAFSRALSMAIKQDLNDPTLPSTKGML